LKPNNYENRESKVPYTRDKCFLPLKIYFSYSGALILLKNFNIDKYRAACF